MGQVHFFYLENGICVPYHPICLAEEWCTVWPGLDMYVIWFVVPPGWTPVSASRESARQITSFFLSSSSSSLRGGVAARTKNRIFASLQPAAATGTLCFWLLHTVRTYPYLPTYWTPLLRFKLLDLDLDLDLALAMAMAMAIASSSWVVSHGSLDSCVTLVFLDPLTHEPLDIPPSSRTMEKLILVPPPDPVPCEITG